MSITAQTNGKVVYIEGENAIILMLPQRSPSRYSLPIFPVMPLKSRNEPVRLSLIHI